MGKAELLSRIKTEFETEANKIVEETELNIRRLKKENEEKISAKRREVFADLDKNLEGVRKRYFTEADIKIRGLLLKAKQDLIDDVFKKVQTEIKGTDYSSFIESMLARSVLDGEGEVIFSNEDSTRFNEDFVRKINNRLKLARKYGSFSGGFILRYSGVEINNTLETIFGHLRKDMEMEVGKILF